MTSYIITNSRFYQFVQKHKDDKEWTDDFAIMTSVRILLFKPKIALKYSEKISRV